MLISISSPDSYIFFLFFFVQTKRTVRFRIVLLTLLFELFIQVTKNPYLGWANVAPFRHFHVVTL